MTYADIQYSPIICLLLVQRNMRNVTERTSQKSTIIRCCAQGILRKVTDADVTTEEFCEKQMRRGRQELDPHNMYTLYSNLH
jgi:hypothetical protein